MLSEFKEMVEYAIQFLSWIIKQFGGVFLTVLARVNGKTALELLFSLLASNGELERILSQLIIINTDKQSLLNNDQLDYLLSLNADAIPLKTFDANPSIDLWWQGKRWRLIQRQRKPDHSRT